MIELVARRGAKNVEQTVETRWSARFGGVYEHTPLSEVVSMPMLSAWPRRDGQHACARARDQQWWPWTLDGRGQFANPSK
jgi:hypothetical protein